MNARGRRGGVRLGGVLPSGWPVGMPVSRITTSSAGGGGGTWPGGCRAPPVCIGRDVEGRDRERWWMAPITSGT